MRLPEVRAELKSIAAAIYVLTDESWLTAFAQRIDELADEMTRRPARRQAAPRSAPMNLAKWREIRRALDERPNATFQEIAVACGVNAGRVSEVASGKRT